MASGTCNYKEPISVKTKYLDGQRVFRDSTQYFIDGDSLLLFAAYHSNVELKQYHGSTLHPIHIVERLLNALSAQTERRNYTIVFFDSHYHLYREECAILDLLRATTIAHFSKQGAQDGLPLLTQYENWQERSYQKFVAEVKPYLMLYYDVEPLLSGKDRVLNGAVLQRLLQAYRSFGHCHQHVYECHVYLLNRLMINGTSVHCFEVQFSTIPTPMQRCSSKNGSSSIKINEPITIDDRVEDVRLSIYCRALATWFPDEGAQDLVPLLRY
jgi:hypothetical protein